MTIHSEHPFLDPTPDAARRLRGRLGGQVSLWTAGAGDARVGLTVSSLLVAQGDPPYLVGLLDPDSDLAVRLERGDDARFVVQLLDWQHRDLAEQFAGRMPAPGGAFRAAEFEQTDAGPRLSDASTWAECVVNDTRPVGWSLEVTARLGRVVIGEGDDALMHRRGRYRRSTE